MTLGLSLAYFASVEVIHAYSQRVNIYSNWWTDHTLAGYFVYKLFFSRVRALAGLQNIHVRGAGHRKFLGGVAALFQGMPISEISFKFKKYCFVLVTYGLLFEMWVGLQRKRLLIESTLTNERPLYSNLSARELKQLEQYKQNRQITFF